MTSSSTNTIFQQEFVLSPEKASSKCEIVTWFEFEEDFGAENVEMHKKTTNIDARSLLFVL
jgi:hypothetical protein